MGYGRQVDRAFALVAVVCVSPAAAHATEPAGWTLSEASPGVTLLHNGHSRSATRGLHVEIGDIVITGANSRAVLVRGEQYAIVAPGSRLQVADPAQSSGLVQFLESVGSVVFSVKKSDTPHFAVQTPYLAAVVKGTTFSVAVDETGAAVQVVEGAVQVSSAEGGVGDLVRPGEIGKVRADDKTHVSIQGANGTRLLGPARSIAPNFNGHVLQHSSLTPAIASRANATLAAGDFERATAGAGSPAAASMFSAPMTQRGEPEAVTLNADTADTGASSAGVEIAGLKLSSEFFNEAAEGWTGTLSTVTSEGLGSQSPSTTTTAGVGGGTTAPIIPAVVPTASATYATTSPQEGFSQNAPATGSAQPLLVASLVNTPPSATNVVSDQGAAFATAPGQNKTGVGVISSDASSTSDGNGKGVGIGLATAPGQNKGGNSTPSSDTPSSTGSGNGTGVGLATAPGQNKGGVSSSSSGPSSSSTGDGNGVGIGLATAPGQNKGGVSTPTSDTSSNSTGNGNGVGVGLATAPGQNKGGVGTGTTVSVPTTGTGGTSNGVGGGPATAPGQNKSGVGTNTSSSSSNANNSGKGKGKNP